VLTIVVVGGTSLSGGSGAMWRTAVGLGIIATISNGFVLLDISPYLSVDHQGHRSSWRRWRSILD